MDTLWPLNSFQCSHPSLPPQTLFLAGAASAAVPRVRPSFSVQPFRGPAPRGSAPQRLSHTAPAPSLWPGFSLAFPQTLMQMPRGSDQPSKICCPAAVLLLLWLPPPSLPPPVSVMVAGPRGVEPPVDAVSDSHLKAKQVHAGCRGGQLCWNSYANISNTQIRDATLSVHYRSSAGSATTVKPRSDKHQ